MTELNIQLPGLFFEEEIRCEYIVTSDVKKQWAVCLDLLAEFDRVCTKHNIQYFAGYGTLLGAVRHGGFIPWDDDIDLVMPRPEYEKLRKIATKEFKHPYFFQTEETDIGFSRPFARLRNSNTTAIQKIEDYGSVIYNQGIFIDIFPLDNFPDDEEEQNRFRSKMISLRRKMSRFSKWSTRYQPVENEKGVYKLKTEIKRKVSSVLRWYMKKYSKHNPYVARFEIESQKYNNRGDTKEWCVPYFFSLERHGAFEKDWYNSVERVQFESLTIPVPQKYNEILNRSYGNWREYVIGNNTHGDVFYDTDRPYTFYKRQKWERNV